MTTPDAWAILGVAALFFIAGLLSFFLANDTLDQVQKLREQAEKDRDSADESLECAFEMYREAHEERLRAGRPRWLDDMPPLPGDEWKSL